MKDPLQKSQTPYDILQIEEKAGLPEINQAFKKLMLEGITDEMKEARQTLCEPLDRAFTDIFLYSDAYLGQLKPSAKNDAVLTQKRANTLEAWSNIEERLFPHAPTMHSVAVLAYWWAVDNEENALGQAAGDTLPDEETAGTPESGDLWMNVIGNWANIISNADFLKAWTADRGDISIGRFSDKLETHFKNLFDNYAKRYQDAGREDRSKLFQDYRLKFVTEVNTGRSLYSRRIRVSKGDGSVVACGGRIFLQKIGLLDAALEEIGKALEKEPQSESLKTLALSLSAFGEIAILMQNKDYDAALTLLEALPETDKKEAEAVRLFVHVCLEKGSMHFHANEFDAAFKLWRKAAKACGLDKKKRSAAPAPANAPPAESVRLTDAGAELSGGTILDSLIPDPNERILVGVLFMMDDIKNAEDELVIMLAAVILGKLSENDQKAIVHQIPSAPIRNRLMRDLGL